MSKYRPLYQFLINKKSNEWNTTIPQIENILGFRLPKSAYEYPAWWSNYGHDHSKNWNSACWLTQQVNLSAGKIQFIKDIENNKYIDKKEIKNINKPNFLKDKPHDWDVIEEINTNLNFSWNPIGRVLLDSNGKLVFPSVPENQSLYKLKIRKNKSISSYIGEAVNLKRRFQNYRNPGKTQQTSIRINKVLSNAIEAGAQISVSISQEVWVKEKEKFIRADLFNKEVRRLFENLAIYVTKSQNIESLNK